MLANAFIDHPAAPTERELASALGRESKELWDRLIKTLRNEYELDGEWTSYSRKAGWSLRLKKGKRNILYLTPCNGSFRAGVVLGARAVSAAQQRSLPKPVLKAIEEAPRHVEGTGVRLDVACAQDLTYIQSLVAIKLTT